MHNPSAPSQGHNQKPAGHTPFSVQRTRPAGQTQQVRAAARKTHRASQPHRPTDSPGRASRSGRQPAKPTGPHAPNRPTDSPGRANPAGPGGSPQTPQGLTAPPPNGLARQGKPSRSGRQPAKTRRAPPAFPSNAPRPVGQASQSFPARRRGKKMKSCFDRLRRPKHPSHPESAGFAGAGRGASPNFWEEQRARQNTRHPRTLPFRTKRHPSGLLPKFLILSGFSDPYTDTARRQ